MFNTFLFDFDYTLIDASEGIVECTNYALVKNGFEPRESRPIEETVGLLLHEIFSFFEPSASPETNRKLINDFSEKAREVMAPKTFYLPDAIPVLEELKKRGFNTAIVTSKTRQMVYDVITPRGHEHLVDHIVGCDTVNNPKPAPDGILECASYFGVLLSDILYIGDSVTDAKTAENAGVSFAGVTTGRTAKDVLKSFPNIYIGDSLTDVFSKILPPEQ